MFLSVKGEKQGFGGPRGRVSRSISCNRQAMKSADARYKLCQGPSQLCKAGTGMEWAWKQWKETVEGHSGRGERLGGG